MVESNIYTAHDIMDIFVYKFAVSVYVYDRMKYCLVFFSRLYSIQGEVEVLVKLKLKLSDLLLLLL